MTALGKWLEVTQSILSPITMPLWVKYSAIGYVSGGLGDLNGDGIDEIGFSLGGYGNWTMPDRSQGSFGVLSQKNDLGNFNIQTILKQDFGMMLPFKIR